MRLKKIPKKLQKNSITACVINTTLLYRQGSVFFTPKLVEIGRGGYTR
jgi:hypothetical protein